MEATAIYQKATDPMEVNTLSLGGLVINDYSRMGEIVFTPEIELDLTEEELDNALQNYEFDYNNIKILPERKKKKKAKPDPELEKKLQALRTIEKEKERYNNSLRRIIEAKKREERKKEEAKQFSPSSFHLLLKRVKQYLDPQPITRRYYNNELVYDKELQKETSGNSGT